MSLTIEAGKFYKTRGGEKTLVYAVYPDQCISMVHGAVFRRNSYWAGMTWDLAGYWNEDSSKPTNFDLVFPWIDPPAVDWEKLPPGILSVAIDRDGEEYGYLTANVSATEYEWIAVPSNIHIGSLSLWHCRLPDGTIGFSGDWRDSLAIRPVHEETKQ